MGTKLSDLTELTTLAAGDLHVVVDVSDTTESADGTTKRITTTNVASGVASVGNFALDSELTAHEADTTSVHGIADTSVLATATTLATAVSNHAAAVDPHADRAYADTVGNLKLAKASNLSDLANAATARTNLGLAAIAASGSASDLSAGTVPSARLGTGGAGLGAKVLADNQTFIDLPTGTLGGSTGATDNRILRADGTGGVTAQSSGCTINDSGMLTVTGGIEFDGGGGPQIQRAGNAVSIGVNSPPIFGGDGSGTNGAFMGATGTVEWRNGNAATSGNDLVIKRSAAGVLEIQNASAAAGTVMVNGGVLRRTSTASDPTTTEFPNDKDFGVHINTGSGVVYYVYNNAGAIKKVALS